MNLFELYEREVNELAVEDKTKRNWLNGGAKVLEALVGQIPASVVEAYVMEWVGGGHYAEHIEVLRDLALERKAQEFPVDIRGAD